MKKNFFTLFFIVLNLFVVQSGFGQCGSGLDSVTIQAITDEYGYEGYWELVPGTNTCGNGTIFAGGNVSQIGCNGGGNQSATSGNGYGDLQTYTEGPWCLPDGATYTIHFVDDYGDGGTDFVVYINGFPVYNFTGTGIGNVFTFTITPPLAYDAGITKISTPLYVNPGSVFIKGKINNYSLNTLQSIELNYSVNGGAAVTQTISGLSVAPFSEYSFTHPIAWTPALNGTYEVAVWPGMLNGNADQNAVNDTMRKLIVVGNAIPNIIDDYLSGTPFSTTIAGSADQVEAPRDLDFHPILSNNELWVMNAGTVNTGGSTVTVYHAGEASQQSLYREDGNAWHFMCLPTAFAFSENTNFASTTGTLDDNHNGTHFSGPALWNSDSMVYCIPNGGNGSHIDMLHQSPYSMGIASDSENVFWVFDDFNHCIMRYDFVNPHEPGGSDHTDGRVSQYTDFSVSRINDDIPDHLVLDHETGYLYIVDGGSQRIIRMNTRSGSVTSSFTPYAEPLAESSIVTGTNWSTYISSGLSQPCGIDLVGNRLIVSDYSNGDIVIYDNTGTSGVELGRIHTGAAGIAGVKIGPDGKIWYVNQLLNTVSRIDGNSPVGIQTNPLESQIGIYPNPAQGFLNLSFAKSWEDPSLSVTVTDAIGNVVVDSPVLFSPYKINLEQEADGIYFLTLKNSRQSLTQKVLIQRAY